MASKIVGLGGQPVSQAAGSEQPDLSVVEALTQFKEQLEQKASAKSNKLHRILELAKNPDVEEALELMKELQTEG